jgi:putative membrane protein
MPMWGYSSGYGMGGVLWMTLGLLLCLVVMGLLLWSILSLVERREHHSLTPGQPPSALEALRQRYARGEIDESTYQRMYEQLAARSVIAPPEPAR